MVTIEELENLMAQAWVAIREGAESVRELSESLQDTKRELTESIKDTKRELTESIMDTKRELSESLQDTKKELRDAQKELSKTVNYWVGRFGNTTGYITEMIIVPGIRKQMGRHGHEFDSLAARKEFYRKDGSAFAETDLLLENGKEVMIVEIKTHLTRDDVDDQVKRLKKLRKREAEVKIAGKSLISAVAGLSIDEDAKKMAADLGMYVIQVIENDQNIKVVSPAKGVGRW
jgi:hypothetical protein